MNNTLTRAAVVSLNFGAVALLVFTGGCRSAATVEPTGGTRAFSGFPGDNGAGGYVAPRASAPVVARTAPTVMPAEPASAPGAVVAPAPVSVEPAPPPVYVVGGPSTSSETSTPAPTGPGKTYTVKGGDSLWVISRREGVTIRELASANSIKENAQLSAGQKLTIPASSGPVRAKQAAATSTVATSGATYTVVAGDALSKIAARLGTTTSALRGANGISGDSIRVGQKLKIPADAKHASGVSAPAPVASSSSAGTKPASTPTPSAAKPTFTPIPLFGEPVRPADAPAPVPSGEAPPSVSSGDAPPPVTLR